jgi:hypothetical protein
MDNQHVTILLIILVLSVMFIGISLKEDFQPNYLYIPAKNTRTPFSKLYNIDNMIAKNNNNLGWKSFWRKNYSGFSDNLNNIFTDAQFKNNPNQRLLFDGVRNTYENTI